VHRPPVGDVIVAVGLAFVALLEGGLIATYGPTWPYVLNAVIHVGLTGVTLCRHLAPRVSLVATYGLLGLLAWLTWASPLNLGVTPAILCAPLALYIAARHLSAAWGLAALAVGIAGTFVMPTRYLPGGGTRVWNVLGILLIVGVYVWASGRRRTEVEYERRLAADRVHARVLEQTRSAHAVAAERARLAREIHDVVAHSLTVVHVQASTGLAIGTTEAQRSALDAVKVASGTALAEIRSLVAALRSEDVEVAGDLARLADAVATARASGWTVEANVPDDETLGHWQAGWPAAVRLTVVRVVQEGVTNAVRHGGPGRNLRVDVHQEGSDCLVSVDNPTTAPTVRPGFGLSGLKERVALAGGTIDFSASDGRFRLTTRVPIAGAPR
jgi:signal transduction histidine kinase